MIKCNVCSGVDKVHFRCSMEYLCDDCLKGGDFDE